MVALIVGISIVIGGVSVFALRNSLLEQLDSQLQSSIGRASGQVMGTGPIGSLNRLDPDDVLDAGRILNGPGQAPGTLALVVIGNSVTAGYLTEDGNISTLSGPQLTALLDLKVNGETHIIHLGDGLGDYKLIGTNQNGVTFVVGLPLEPVNSTVTRLAWVAALVALIGAAGVALIATAFMRSAMRPLERVSAAASRVSELELERGVVEGFEGVPTDGIEPESEVGHVVTAFNTMLDNVGTALIAREASEKKVRRFVADASHELRTPLASIRGYSELIRRMGGESNPDVVRSLSRIESESIRMTGLVEDLLLLARLDEGRELVQGEVDLSQIVVDSFSDALVSKPDYVWEIDVPDESVLVTGDSARLHQVVVNLVANASAHTPAGTRVEVSLSVVDDGSQPVAQVVVADNGPGIDAETLPHLFERFVRGDESRARTTGNTGLGLAIVQAIVEAHHGTVEVESVPGDTRFIVQLPALPPRPLLPPPAPDGPASAD